MDNKEIRSDEDRIIADFMFLPQHLKSSSVDKPTADSETDKDG